MIIPIVTLIESVAYGAILITMIMVLAAILGAAFGWRDKPRKKPCEACRGTGCEIDTNGDFVRMKE